MKTNQRLQKKFREIMNELLLRKAAKLVAVFYPAPGKLPKLTKEYRERKTNELVELVEAAYLPYLRRWVKKRTEKSEVRFARWIEKNDKALEVKNRLFRRRLAHRHLVYVSFGANRRCLKVGRSDGGLRRIANQWSNYYFRDARRVVVYFPNRSKKRTLPALECALTHIFPPFHQYQKPSERKYSQKCPACERMKFVEREVKQLFPA